MLYSSARAAITKYCRLGDLNNRNLVLEFQKSEIMVSAGLVSPEVSLLGLQMATFSLCPHVAFLCMCAFLLSLPLLIKKPMLLH